MNRNRFAVVGGIFCGISAGIVVGIYLVPHSANRDRAQTWQLKDGEIKGELVRDFLYDTPMGTFYRVNVQTSDGNMAYPILALPEELNSLNQKYTSREESGTEGDLIAINLKGSMIMSLDEKILIPSDIRILKKASKSKSP